MVTRGPSNVVCRCRHLVLLWLCSSPAGHPGVPLKRNIGTGRSGQAMALDRSWLTCGMTEAGAGGPRSPRWEESTGVLCLQLLGAGRVLLHRVNFPHIHCPWCQATVGAARSPPGAEPHFFTLTSGSGAGHLPLWGMSPKDWVPKGQPLAVGSGKAECCVLGARSPQGCSTVLSIREAWARVTFKVTSLLPGRGLHGAIGGAGPSSASFPRK